MSKIDELIAKLCPEGVEWKSLKSLFKISRGRVISKDYLNANKGVYPVYSSQTINNGIIGNINTFDYEGEFLSWTTDGANAGTVFYRNGKFSVTNVCGLLKTLDYHVLNPKFAYYCLSVTMKDYVNYGMGNPKLMSNVVEKITIPIPPLPVQEEIVRILDKFTALEAELEARTRQYEYYRNQLLSFEGKNVEWKTLKSVLELKRGTRVVKSQLAEIGEIPVYQNSLKPLGYFERSNVIENSTYIICAGAAGDIGFSKIPFWAADDCFVFTNSVEIDSKYLYYFLKTKQDFIYSRVRRASIPRLSRENIENIKIPVPPLEEQERIVTILDQFDALVNDISVGLPAEIQARRQQYEYYRGKLLTFDKVVGG